MPADERLRGHTKSGEFPKPDLWLDPQGTYRPGKSGGSRSWCNDQPNTSSAVSQTESRSRAACCWAATTVVTLAAGTSGRALRAAAPAGQRDRGRPGDCDALFGAGQMQQPPRHLRMRSAYGSTLLVSAGSVSRAATPYPVKRSASWCRPVSTSRPDRSMRIGVGRWLMRNSRWPRA